MQVLHTNPTLMKAIQLGNSLALEDAAVQLFCLIPRDVSKILSLTLKRRSYLYRYLYELSKAFTFTRER